MKFLSLNLLITVLSIVCKVSSSGTFEDNKECHLYYQWIGEDPNDYPECCDGSNPYMCNDNNRVNSITVNAKYYDHPNFSTFPIFDQLEHLLIYDYGILRMQFVEPFDLHANIFKQPSLKLLEVDSKFVNGIATDIDPSCPLEELTLNNTEIENLPNSIFKLNNLKKIGLNNNSLMNVKIVKFKNSPIECNFESTTIDCYQEGACSNLASNNYRKCTEDEINEILGLEKEGIKTTNTTDNQPKTDNKENTDSNNKTKSNGNNGILIGGLIGIGVIVLIAAVVIVKKINKKNKLDDIDYEIYERKKERI